MTTSPPANTPRPLTGRTVLLCFIGFFGVVATVNAIMIRAAVTTFAGTDTPSAYKAGLAYKHEEAAASAQTALNWYVDGRLTRSSSGEADLAVDVKDKTRAPVYGIAVTARLEHPLNARLDHDIALARAADNSFHGVTGATAGQWTLVIEVTRDSERVYRSKSRVVLR